METFCRITMQPPLFEIKLKTFPTLHRRDHFILTRVSQGSSFCTYVFTVSQIAR